MQQCTVCWCGLRHEEDVRRQQKIASEVKGSLDAQVAAVRDRQLAEAQQEALEVQRMQQHWAQLQVSNGPARLGLRSAQLLLHRR